MRAAICDDIAASCRDIILVETTRVLRQVPSGTACEFILKDISSLSYLVILK
jgi:hypothetical protein